MTALFSANESHVWTSIPRSCQRAEAHRRGRGARRPAERVDAGRAGDRRAEVEALLEQVSRGLRPAEEFRRRPARLAAAERQGRDGEPVLQSEAPAGRRKPAAQAEGAGAGVDARPAEPEPQGPELCPRRVAQARHELRVDVDLLCDEHLF